MDRYQQQWENLGSHDPYWAVLSEPASKGGKWDKNRFYASGQHEIEQVLSNLSQLGAPLQSNGIALDFGCGVGRLCRALSAHFEKVIGVDVSSSMLDEARAQHRDYPNIEFVHNVSPDLRMVHTDTLDMIYSNIVLQHMPPTRQLRFIEEFCRILRPGGVAVFQTPSRHDLATFRGWVNRLAGNRVLNVMRRIVHGKFGIMEVHTLPKADVLAALGNSRMSVLDIERYDSTGPGFESYRYYAIKG
jgi:ubiquinone/menaquinone biosynthesis C-methylase UbiE